jgi:hypothetical protein
MKKSVQKTSKAALWMCAVALAGIVGSCNEEKVAVTAVKPTSEKMIGDSITVYIGQTVLVNTLVEPSNATDKSVSWVSAKPDIATVSSASSYGGNVVGVATGTTTITVASVSNPETKAEVKVGVPEGFAYLAEGVYAGAGYVNENPVAQCSVVLKATNSTHVTWALKIIFSAEAQAGGIPIPEFEIKKENMLLTVESEGNALKLTGSGKAEPTDLGHPDVDITGTIVNGVLTADLVIGGFGMTVAFQGQLLPPS